MHEQTIASYVASFNERDARKRRAAIDELYTEDCEYTDPHVSLRGRDAIDAFVGGVREQFPTAIFELASVIDTHHDRARFNWNVTLEGSREPLGVGFDIVTFDGPRIRQVYGFIDKGPAHVMKASVERYLAAWNETDEAKRRAILEAVYSKHGTYTDPLGSVRGIEAISAFIAAVQQQFKGVVFVLGDTFDAHHDQARFTWNAMAPGLLEPVAIGFDVAVFERGRIRDVHGFLDRAPANAR